MSKPVLWLAMALLLTSCASNNGRSYVETKMTETLEIEIFPNTSKMFTYRLRWPEPSPERMSGMGGDRRGPPDGGVKLGRDTHDRLLVNTAYVVEHSGYCREGFFELDRNISRFHLWVRGECKDGATDADLKEFGAKQTLTAERWRQSPGG